MSKIHPVHPMKHLTAVYSLKPISTTSLSVSEKVFLLPDAIRSISTPWLKEIWAVGKGGGDETAHIKAELGSEVPQLGFREYIFWCLVQWRTLFQQFCPLFYYFFCYTSMLYFHNPFKRFCCDNTVCGRLLLLPDPAQPVCGGRDDKRTAGGLDHL